MWLTCSGDPNANAVVLAFLGLGLGFVASPLPFCAQPSAQEGRVEGEGGITLAPVPIFWVTFYPRASHGWVSLSMATQLTMAYRTFSYTVSTSG